MPAQRAVLHVYVDTYDKPTQTFGRSETRSRILNQLKVFAFSSLTSSRGVLGGDPAQG